MKLFILFGLLGVVTVLGSVEFAPCEDSNGNPKKPGDVWYEDKCRQVTCGISPIAGEPYMETIGCPTVSVQAPCELSSKPYENYPGCCPIVKCTSTVDNPEAYVWNAHGHGR